MRHTEKTYRVGSITPAILVVLVSLLAIVGSLMNQLEEIILWLLVIIGSIDVLTWILVLLIRIFRKAARQFKKELLCEVCHDVPSPPQVHSRQFESRKLPVQSLKTFSVYSKKRKRPRPRTPTQRIIKVGKRK